MDDDKIIFYAGSANEIIEELEKIHPDNKSRINATPDNVDSGLAKLVLIKLKTWEKHS